MKELKQLDQSKRSFIANGNTYYIETGDLSIERWAKYEEYVHEMAYGVSFSETFKAFRDITDFANKLQFSDIAVLAHNMQNGLIGVMDRSPAALKVCALFINQENEDRGIINDDMVSAKIDDWTKEGYAIGPFFQLALAFSRLINEISNTLSPESLEMVLKQLGQLNAEQIQNLNIQPERGQGA